jgi:SagB-type dehydrogenase family enzyme
MVTGDRQVLQKLAHTSARLGRHGRKSTLFEIFHENTKLSPLTSRAYAAWILNFIRSHRSQQLLELSHKVYTLMERRALPRVEPRTALEQAIVERRSLRTFTGAALDLEHLARLLFFTYGRTDPRGLLRAVASGGALYPLELYVVALRVAGLEAGLYHYDSATNALDVVRLGVSLADFKAAVNCEGIDVDNAAVALVVCASFRRSTVKYLDRGYRMVLMEAGEVAHNLGLLTTSMGLGACLVGGFNDDMLSALLEIDGVDEAPLLPMLIGHPVPPASAPGAPTSGSQSGGERS